MKFIKQIVFLILMLIHLKCADNGCIKRVTVPDNVIQTTSGITFEPSYTIDVPCEFDEATEFEVAEVLQNFSYDIVNFSFIPNTGNNTSKLTFEIILKNNNSRDVTGLPIFIMRADGVEFSANYSGNSGSCKTIFANGICTINYSKESSLDLGVVNSLELVSIKYLFVE